LQGALFQKFRDVILGYQHVDTLVAAPTEAEERVGKEQRPTDESATAPGTERDKTEIDETERDKTKKEESECEDEKWITVARRTKPTHVAEERETAKQNKGMFRDHYLETIQLTKK
jgi:hypothetical protein